MSLGASTAPGQSDWMGLVSHASKQSLQVAIEDMAQVERILEAGVASQEHLPTELSRRLVGAGGKRIRPYLMCLCYRSLVSPYKARAKPEELYHLAAVAELVHTATLFHDDVLDSSPTRRDMAAAHMTHGNKNAILVGDFVYAEAFFILMKKGLLEPSRELAQTIKTIVEGELRQHQVAQARDLSFANYERIALAKTAALFAWCTETGAWAAGSEHVDRAKNFGRALGYAFQMADDLIDTYELDAHTARDLDLHQWIDGAAPLPLVLLKENSDAAVEGLWQTTLGSTQTTTADRRTAVASLQKLAKQPSIVRRSLELVDRELESAFHDLNTLGAVAGLRWAIDAIWERGLEGAKLSGCFADGDYDQPAFRRIVVKDQT